MIYTQARRRAMNKAVKAMFPDIQFYESPDGIPVMECQELPPRAKKIMEQEDLFRNIDEVCVRRDSIGMLVPDYGKFIPVFIESIELQGKDIRSYYRVNYVSPTVASREKSAAYISEGKLYAVI